TAAILVYRHFRPGGTPSTGGPDTTSTAADTGALADTGFYGGGGGGGGLPVDQASAIPTSDLGGAPPVIFDPTSGNYSDPGTVPGGPADNTSGGGATTNGGGGGG